MIRNYFKTLLRNMRKNKQHTAINIVGMSVAFTCTVLLIVLVYFQFSFDSFHQHRERLFQVYNYSIGPQGEERSGSMGYPAAPALKAEGTGIEQATRYKYGGRGVKYGEKELDMQTQLVDPDFFTMFSFPVVAGDNKAPLQDPGNAAISEYAAAKLFGKEDPVGKPISVRVDGEWKALVISAVMQDFPQNSTITFDVLARPEISAHYTENKDKWNNTHHPVYVQLSANATQKSVEAQLRNVVRKYNMEDTTYMKNKGYQRDETGAYASMRLLPLEDIYFDRAMHGGSAISKASLYVLLLVAFVILVIACFNFINLSIGLSFTRTKEVGIRKCLGAGKRQVWLQIWGESFFTVLVSLLAGTAASLFILRYLGKTTRIGVSDSVLYQPAVAAILLLLLFVVSFAAAGYPSFIMGKLKTVDVLKGNVSAKPGVFRNALIVVQFVIACVLICSTIVIYRQFQHLRGASLGYTTASLISVPVHDLTRSKTVVQQMRTRLLSQTSIISVSGSSINLGVGKDGSTSKIGLGFDYNGRPVNTNIMPADHDILKTLNLPLTQGRDFTTDYAADTSTAVIVTESMAKQLSDKGVMGLSFYSDSSQPKWHVVGVIPDFHLYSMHEKAEALTITLANNRQLAYVLIRIATQNPKATMDLVKSMYAQVEPGVDFKGSFVDENIERWYQSEATLSKMFSVAAVVAIVLSCMGLFGIAFIVIRQRVKEIGVRKVLGASVGSVAVLVTKEFIKPVLLAIVIALPLAWWATNKWLQNFEYRIPVQWTVLLATAVIAVVISIATVSFQAIKAAVANPVKSLRTE